MRTEFWAACAKRLFFLDKLRNRARLQLKLEHARTAEGLRFVTVAVRRVMSVAYKTPVQLIETVDKPVGGYLTFRQFLYILGGVGLAALFSRPFWKALSFGAAIITLLLCVGPACVLAFYRVGSLGLDDYLWGALHFFLAPKRWPEK